MTITVRPASVEDEEFLFQVYASTRAEELAPVPWTAEQKASFLRMQSRAQRSHYATYYPQAEYDLILLDSRPVGRLFILRGIEEIRIMDIALLPDYRGRGIGSSLLEQILNEGRECNLPVTIHVEQFNPALRLYKRLGFQLVEDKGVYYFMKWSREGQLPLEGIAQREDNKA